jgi:cobalt-zinc-cadmium resistance protein CzcA
LERKIIDISLRYRLIIILGVVGIIGLGVFQYTRLPVDAFPDISPVMVPVFADAHGMAPEEIERLITFPIESAMNGLPGVTQVKSTSAFGMAAIYVYFKDSIDIYFARQIVSERLTSALAELPEMHEPPTLGPISTGLGQVFIYYLALEEGADTGGKEPGMYLREINDWVVKYQLRSIPGVTDVLSVGGHVLQYQIQVDPNALTRYHVSLEELVGAVRDNNRNVGGQFMTLGQEEYLVRGIGLLEKLEDIRNIPVRTISGIPIKIGDIADVRYGPEIRRGVVSRNGREEVVSGIVLQLYGEDTSKVIGRLNARLPAIQASLPAGVTIVPYYNQAELVQKATGTVLNALLQGAVLVILVLALFLGNLRTALAVTLALPLSALIAVIAMRKFGVSANLMSLGGIAIAVGMLVDGTIVMVENIFRHLNSPGGDDSCGRRELIRRAGGEVSRPIIFSIAIIMLVFLPIFTLEGVEGKMFRPLAFTIIAAMFGSLLSAIMITPAVCSWLLSRGKQREFPLIERLKGAYRPLVRWALGHRRLILILSAGALAASIALAPLLGTEFIPTLEEGSIFIGVTMAPSISLEEGTATVQALERKITRYGEVREVVSRIGRPETGSHPHPVNYAEIHIELKPRREWPRFRSKEDLVEALNGELSAFPGVQLNFTQPIQNAFDELISGIKAELAIRIYGDDLAILREKAGEIQHAIENVPGLADLAAEQNYGQPQVQVIADREACARYGIPVSEILELVELAIGGEVIDNLYLNTRRFGIHVRYQEAYRTDPDAIGNLLVHTGNGTLIPLKEVAEVKQVFGPIQINRENNQRRWVIMGNIRGRDMGSVVADIRDRIKDTIALPPGYYIEYGGQFANQQRAMTRLAIIVPVVLGLIFLMLYFAFGTVRNALLIILNVPLALIGGILGLYLTGEYLSVPAAVGFIALFGIAVQNGVVLATSINQLRAEGMGMDEAVEEGALLRLRPVLMTALTTVLGLLPLLFARGIGAEVQRPLAVVVVFGLTTATMLTLVVIPAFYRWFAPPPNACIPDRMQEQGQP